MTCAEPSETSPSRSFPVLQARDFTVIAGANLRDPLAAADHLVLSDTYQQHHGAEQTRIAICTSDDGATFTVSRDSVIGRPGAQIILDSCITFMTGDAKTAEAIILQEMLDGVATDSYLLPVSPILPGQDYTLVTIDRLSAPARFAGMACVSFARGTHVFLADGTQTMIETLRPGDRLMTRDHGAQALRWIGMQTVRAEGAFAPVVIRKGTLNNSADLTLGPNHRLFLFQRADGLGGGQSEITVRAGLLINGDSIVQSTGGFIDYYQLLFDSHEIIYVEGIAAESMLANARSRAALPPEVAEALAGCGTMKRSIHVGDLKAADIPGPNPAEVLLRAVSG